jgi:peptidoglycan-N-acetylglucosamine deacetylase
VPRIALTFDDGPDPRWTADLLDLLLAVEAHATFFPLAGRAAKHPRLVGRMLEEGHTVGVHCDRHLRHSDRDLDSLRVDTASALRALRSLGADPALWRTPWGDLAPFSAQVAAEYGLRIVGWTVDTHDWRGDSASEMFEQARPELREGAVVLAHDAIGPGSLRSTARETVEFVRLLGAYADDRGLKLQALT